MISYIYEQREYYFNRILKASSGHFLLSASADHRFEIFNHKQTWKSKKSPTQTLIISIVILYAVNENA